MRIWNNEGFEVESCGNASRCIADLLFDEKETSRATIDTKGGFLRRARPASGWSPSTMGVPRFGWKDIPLSEAFHDTRHIELQVGPIEAPLIHSPSVVNVGNPHCIFWVKDLDVVDLAKVGPMLEHPSAVSRARQYLPGPGRCRGSHYPEGVGARRRTDAGLRHGGLCRDRGGRAHQAGRPPSAGSRLPGGDLLMEWRETDDHILMTGPVAYEFEGALPAASPLSMRPEIVTFGCRLNTYESEVMRGHAEQGGARDAVIFNTCAVTAEATRQARQAIRRARTRKPARAHHRHRLRGADRSATCSPPCPRSISFSATRKNSAPQSWTGSARPRACRSPTSCRCARSASPHAIDGLAERTRAFVAGAEWLRPPLHLLHHSVRPRQFAFVAADEVIEQVRRLVANGYPEIVLTGVDITSWGADCQARRDSAVCAPSSQGGARAQAPAPFVDRFDRGRCRTGRA